ncbi:Phosphoglycolate phosphatase [Amantichitinum ursilacus]|uniref:Phosphoglycolate phosphatase n=1 Tax=Amantichitinum ursilacus TaxID=857265 RepID=A0A0N0XJW0_9NEIS|nr:Phosphoglycolate phosphatase [Amantichitinum ursilacus]
MSNLNITSTDKPRRRRTRYWRTRHAQTGAQHALRQPVWLFDLDNTLHNASRHAFPVIDAAMAAHVAQALGLDAAAAKALCMDYWDRYGATLSGLIRHHPHIRPQDFLHATHPLAELTAHVYPMRGLQRTLARLPGRKILFTNGPHHYGAALAEALGIARYFEAIHGIDDGGYIPKPQTQAFLRLLKRFRLNPRRCVMVEDSLANLETARKLGMRTVWLRPGWHGHGAVDVGVRELKGVATVWRNR